MPASSGKQDKPKVPDSLNCRLWLYGLHPETTVEDLLGKNGAIQPGAVYALNLVPPRNGYHMRGSRLKTTNMDKNDIRTLAPIVFRERKACIKSYLYLQRGEWQQDDRLISWEPQQTLMITSWFFPGLSKLWRVGTRCIRNTIQDSAANGGRMEKKATLRHLRTNILSISRAGLYILVNARVALCWSSIRFARKDKVNKAGAIHL